MMKLHRLLIVALTLALPSAVLAGSYTWTDTSGNHQWTNSANWSPNTGYPVTTADDAVFTNRQGVAVDVNGDIAIRYLWARQAKNVTNTYRIASDKTFAPYCLQGYNESLTNTVVIQGGTFKPRTTLFVGFQDAAAGGARFPVVNMILTNTVLNTGNLSGGIHLGRNVWSIGYVRGELDARGVSINHNGVLNVLNVPQLWIAVNGVNINRGRIWLPPSLTNITVNSLIMRGISDLDLGDVPQLETLAITSEALIGRGYITYRDGGGNTHTNLPPNVALKIGSPGTPAAFEFGDMYNITLNMRWSKFRRFEGYFSRVNIGRSANAGTAFAELDLASMGELAGDFTDRNANTPILRLGGGPRYGTGILKLPGTVTNLTFGTFYLGDVPDLYAPPYSVLHLGSNTQLRALTVTNDFRIGRGRFEYLDAGGAPKVGFPPNVACRIGSADRRAAMRVGNCYHDGTVTTFGPGLASFEGWLTELRVCAPEFGWTWAWHASYPTLDLRGVEVSTLNVTGAVSVGLFPNNPSKLYLSSAGMTCGSLAVGGAAASGGGFNLESWCYLSNAVVTVSNAAVVDETGRIAATLAGESAGIDLLTGNLTVAPPDGTLPASYGRIDLTFAGDPLDPADDYFGLRLKGNSVAALQALHDATPSRLTWSISGLSSRNQARFGIHYDATRNLTVVGLLRTTPGSMILLR
jgi:hypothetical protein